MQLFKHWANTFKESESITPDSEMLVANLKAFLLEDVDPESVDLSSFKVHDELDQDFWNQPDDNLDPEIQEKLLIILVFLAREILVLKKKEVYSQVRFLLKENQMDSFIYLKMTMLYLLVVIVVHI